MLDWLRVFKRETDREIPPLMALSKKQVKVVEVVGQRVEMTREFMNDWLLFNQILSAYPSPGVNKAQLENQFLKVKSKLAREHKVLRDALAGDYAIDANTMNIISGATSLESIYAQSEVSVKKLQNEWHRSFISINETLGTLEDKKRRAESGEKVFLMTPGQGPVSKGAGISEKTKKNLIILVVIAAIFGGMMAVPPVRQFYIKTLQDIGIMKRTNQPIQGLE